MSRRLLAAALACVALGAPFAPVAQAASVSFKNVRCEDPANRKLIDADIRRLQIRYDGQTIPFTSVARNLTLDSVKTVGSTATLLTCRVRLSFTDGHGQQSMTGLFRVKALKNGQFETSFVPNY